MRTIIHVNQQVIARNRTHGTTDPPITVKDYKRNRYGHDVTIHGPSKVVYHPDNPLVCGARLWIETESEVDVE